MAGLITSNHSSGFVGHGQILVSDSPKTDTFPRSYCTCNLYLYVHKFLFTELVNALFQVNSIDLKRFVKKTLQCQIASAFTYSVRRCIQANQGTAYKYRAGTVVIRVSLLAKTSISQGINIFRRRATGFHRQTKLFELTFFIRKTIFQMVKPGGQNQFTLCLVP